MTVNSEPLMRFKATYTFYSERHAGGLKERFHPEINIQTSWAEVEVMFCSFTVEELKLLPFKKNSKIHTANLV